MLPDILGKKYDFPTRVLNPAVSSVGVSTRNAMSVGPRVLAACLRERLANGPVLLLGASLAPSPTDRILSMMPLHLQARTLRSMLIPAERKPNSLQRQH